MLQQPGRALGNGGLVEQQLHRQVRVGVGQAGVQGADGHGHAQLFPAFPGQRLGAGLARLQLAAHKFPQKAAGLVGGALPNEKAPVLTDEGGGNSDGFRHGDAPFR